MGRPKKKPVYLLVESFDLGCVSEDRIFDLDSEPDNCLLDELQCPIADEVLIALRKAFSLSYPRNYLITGLQAALHEIRRIGVEALKPIPEVLADLKLKPVPSLEGDTMAGKVFVFQYSFARASAIDIAVKVNGKSKKLLDVAHWAAANSLICTLREVIADTFLEAYDEDQHTEILCQIRSRIWKVLPSFNVCLRSIEIEPIASLEHF